MRTSTKTILFTDLVSSTRYLSGTGDRPDAFRQSMFGVLRRAAADHQGTEVKNLGDGLMVAFDSTVDGVEAAVAMQQAVHRLRPVGNEGRALIRLGLSVGEVSCEDDDYFGIAVVEAARLCAVAKGGQILTSDLVRILVGTRVAHGFQGMGRIELRGLPQPVEAWEIRWEPVAEIALPPALTTASRGWFVGRDEELAALADAGGEAAEGRRRTVLVAGEPGIGKTRLVSAGAVSAHASGCTVLYGRCDPDLGVAYQPFAEAIRHYVRSCEVDILNTHLAEHGGELGRLVPELSRRVPEVPSPASGDPEGDRLRLFEAVDGLLGLASRETQLMLVLDDLHWADLPSLLLLVHLVRSVEPSAMLMVATYRDTELDREHPLTSTLADLRRWPGVSAMRVSGLDGSQVTELLTEAAGHELDEIGRVVATQVHAQTQGNPFFVTEILRHLVETGAVYRRDGAWTADEDLEQLGLPEGVRDVVRGRLSRLSSVAHQVLVVAAVAGREFSAQLLAATRDAGPPEQMVQGLDEALGARLIVESDPVESAGYIFVHAIVRQTIYRDLTSARRMHLHRQVAEAIEQLHGSDDASSLAALAHHFAEAAPIGQWEKAADYALRAARRALEQMAHEEASRVLERALRALDTAGRPDLARRCDLLLALSEVRSRALDVAGTRSASLAAADVARTIGSSERLAEAAYWYSARCVAGERDEVAISMEEEALAGMSGASPAQRARALAVLAQLRSFAGDSQAGDSLSREALDLASETGDSDALALAMYARYQSLWGSERVIEQLALGEQLLSCPVAMPSGWLASVDAHRLVTLARLALGDLTEFADGTERLERIGEELKSRYFLTLASLWKTCRALVEGRFADAEEGLGRTGSLAGDDRNFRNGLAAQHFFLSFERGNLANLEPLMAEVIAATPGLVAFRAALALAHLELGDLEHARRELDELATDDFSAVPRDLVWPGSISLMCEVCAGVDDVPRAEVLYRMFSAHSGLLVVTANGLHCPGAADRFLGMVATTAGRLEQAEPHFRSALQLEERIRARPLAARTRYWYGRMLLGRDDPGDKKVAGDLLNDSLHTARELGMARLAEQVGDLLGVGAHRG